MAFIRVPALKTVVREVYENIGQMLSMVRIQISTSNTGYNEVPGKEEADAGSLVGKAIRDLRNLCKHIYPDQECVAELANVLEKNMQSFNGYPVSNRIEITGLPSKRDMKTGFILFRIIQEILFTLQRQNTTGEPLIRLTYRRSTTQVTIEYFGQLIDWSKSQEDYSAYIGLTGLSIPETMALVGGRLSARRTKENLARIRVIIPKKRLLYG